MIPAGAIYGRVYDQKQRPLANAGVGLNSVGYESGVRVSRFVQSTTTNDLGEYRLFGLKPGRYYVSALHPEGGPYRPRGLVPGEIPGFFAFGRRPVTSRRLTSPAGSYFPIFFPDTTDEQNATVLDLVAGAELGGIDITVFPVEKRFVRGAIVDPATGQGPPNVRLFVSRSPARINDNPYVGVDSSTGVFEVSDLLPGSYMFFATAGELTGRAAIEIGDQDLNGVTIDVERGFTISGRAVTDRGSPAGQGLRVTLRPDPEIANMKLPGPNDSGLVSGDGSFLLVSVPAGNYRVYVDFPSQDKDIYVRSIRFGRIDVLKEPLRIAGPVTDSLEIVVGTASGALDGLVLNSENIAVAAVTAVLIPDSDERTRLDLYRVASTDAFGRFHLSNIAPGNYTLFAWSDVADGIWTEQEFLRSLEGLGTPVRIPENSLVQAQTRLLQ
jgi:hypothetical protein